MTFGCFVMRAPFNYLNTCGLTFSSSLGFTRIKFLIGLLITFTTGIASFDGNLDEFFGENWYLHVMDDAFYELLGLSNPLEFYSL